MPIKTNRLGIWGDDCLRNVTTLIILQTGFLYLEGCDSCDEGKVRCVGTVLEVCRVPDEGPWGANWTSKYDCAEWEASCEVGPETEQWAGHCIYPEVSCDAGRERICRNRNLAVCPTETQPARVEKACERWCEDSDDSARCVFEHGECKESETECDKYWEHTMLICREGFWTDREYDEINCY